jgi:Tfp pilus assembly protein PilN
MTRLNLLPPEIRKEILLSKKNARLRQYVYYSIMVSLAFVALFGVVMFIIWTRQDEATRRISLAKQQIEEQDVDFKKATDLYSRINLIKKIKKDSLDWKLILTELGKQTPGGVLTDSITYSKTDNRLKITGLSVSDTETVAFKEALSKSDYFNYVDIENTSEAKDDAGRTARSFSLSLSLKLDKLKK